MFIKTGRVLTYFPKFTLDLFGIFHRCYDELTFLKELILIKQMYQKNVIFVAISIF